MQVITAAIRRKTVTKIKKKKVSSNLDSKSYKKFAELVNTEKRVIQQILSLGYKNPKDDEGHNGLLEGEWNGIKWRRFLLDVGEIDQFNLEPSQIKKHEFSEEWCKQLKSLIEKYGLEYTIFTSNEYNLPKEKIEAGHNRNNCWTEIYGSTKPIPRTLISPPYYIDKDNNKLEVLDKVANDYVSTVSRIKSNRPPPNDPYKMEDIAVQVKDLFDRDPRLGGKNPSGKWFESSTSKVYHDLLDDLHPYQFTSKKARTDIFKLMDPNIPNKKKKVITDATKAYDLKNLGWFYQEPFMSSFDQKNKAYVFCTDDTIPNFRSTLYVKMVRHGGMQPDVDAEKRFVAESIFVHCVLTKVADLAREREYFLKHVLEWNIIAETYGFPKIKKVFFPKQLLDNLDKDCLFELQGDGTFKQVS